jgi:hypothetical protein
MQNISKQTTTKAIQGLIGNKLEIATLANAVLNNKKHIKQTINKEMAHCGWERWENEPHIVRVWIGAVCSIFVEVNERDIIKAIIQ